MSNLAPRKRSVEVITPEHERLLWKLGILNLTESIGLSRATYFYFCKAFGVYSRNALRDVIREQFRFGEDECGRFIEFVDFEKPDGEAVVMSAVPTRRVVQYDDPDNDYSVYKIMVTYMTHIPLAGEFFRRPISATVDSPIPIQFSNRPIGINHLSHYLSDMMKSAGLWKEHFTTQSIKSAVVSVLFRVGIDEDISRQRTRWWGLGRAVSSASQCSAGPKVAARGSLPQSDRQKLVVISKLLDPPQFTQLSPADKKVVTKVIAVQQVSNTLECQSFSVENSENAPSTSRVEIPVHIQTSPVSLQQETGPSYHQKEPGSQAEAYKWYHQGEPSFIVDSDTEEEQFQPKRQRYASPPDSPDGQQAAVSAPPPPHEFVAMSGPVTDHTAAVVPKHLSRLPIIKVEPEEEDDDEDDDCCVVASSMAERPDAQLDRQAGRATSTKRSATSSTTPSSRAAAAVRNQMQCLTATEMKEASSRPPKDGTSALALAFKFAYEIDHNGEVAASREIRALHTTGNKESSTAVKRRLLPLNVVDSAGNDATERQEEFSNFAIKLSDFFPSVSRQRGLDIRDVVIRGTRGQGTDRLNVELVLAEKKDAPEPDVQLVEHYADFQ